MTEKQQNGERARCQLICLSTQPTRQCFYIVILFTVHNYCHSEEP